MSKHSRKFPITIFVILFVLIGSFIFIMVNQTESINISAQSINDSKNSNFFDAIHDSLGIDSKKINNEYTTIVIDDEEKLGKFMSWFSPFNKNEELNDISSKSYNDTSEGAYKVQQVELTYLPRENLSQKEFDPTLSISINRKQLIKNFINLQHGWYNADDDLIFRRVVDGSDTLHVNIDEMCTTQLSPNLKLDNSLLSDIGFGGNTSYTASYSGEIKVPVNQRMEVNIYKTYQKESFSVWNKKSFGNLINSGNASVYLPTGLLIVKISYEKSYCLGLRMQNM